MCESKSLINANVSGVSWYIANVLELFQITQRSVFWKEPVWMAAKLEFVCLFVCFFPKHIKALVNILTFLSKNIKKYIYSTVITTTIILEGSICFKTAKDYPQHDNYLCQSVSCIAFTANVLKSLHYSEKWIIRNGNKTYHGSTYHNYKKIKHPLWNNLPGEVFGVYLTFYSNKIKGSRRFLFFFTAVQSSSLLF